MIALGEVGRRRVARLMRKGLGIPNTPPFGTSISPWTFSVWSAVEMKILTNDEGRMWFEFRDRVTEYVPIVPAVALLSSAFSIPFPISVL